MSTRTQMGVVSARMSTCLIALALLVTACNPLAGTWGLLASPGYENKPSKGVYFFPGDPKASGLFTSVSNKQWRDYAWNDSSPLGFAARNQIIAEIAAVGANVIFAQYNGAYSDKHFVNNTEAAFMGVFFSSRLVNGPLVIPSLEASFQCGGDCPSDAQPVFDPVRDIAPPTTTGVSWITHLVNLIVANGVQDKWAQLYDRFGVPRYAIQISEAASKSLPPNDPKAPEDVQRGGDRKYVEALEEIQRQVEKNTGITIGFVLTPVEDSKHYSIIQSNPDRIADLTDCHSCLAIMPYFSELPRVHQECEDHAPAGFRGFIDCNEGGNIGNLARLKKDRTKLWVNSGTPYYLDLDSGYDAHIVFNDRRPAGQRSVRAVWGETGYLYDAWRNAQSELKGHQGDGNRAPSGVIYNSWNGYTEVAVAVDSTHLKWDPSFLVPVCRSSEGPCETVGHEPLGYPYSPPPVTVQRWMVNKDFNDLRRRWLKDVFSVDPRLCDHYYYENGQRKFHVIGAICEKFTEKYGEYGPLGAPTSDAYQKGAWTVQDFRSGQVYWNNTGAHEMHGGIYAKYKTLLQGGRNLGAPLTDELSTPNHDGYYNHLEQGSIYWTSRTLGVGIWGAFRDRWAELQWERGRLSYPVLEPTLSSDGIGWFARFEGGNMYARSISAPAFEVWGGILAEYGRLGWERSWLGYPITGELDSGFWCAEGRYNRFQNGYIDWCPGHNACAHHGDGRCADGRARPNS